MNSPLLLTPKLLTFSVLRLLADGKFHSGEVLARQLGVSRASIHNALRDIGEYGLTVYSVRGRGYQLVEPPQWLDAGQVLAALKMPEKFHIEIADSAVSSNTVLLQRAAQGAPSGSVLAVEWQSAGRGRLGRTWHSGLGNALTFSVLWRFPFGLAALSGLSLAVGVALMRALRKLDVADVGLKWPNDVLCRRGKLAGILIEAQGDMLGPSAVVIGVGLNLRLPQAVAQRIDQPVSDLISAVAAMPERNELLALLLQELAGVLEEFARHGFASVRAEWEREHVYQNRQVTMLLPDGSQASGVVRGVTEDGALQVETVQGMQVFNAGEISLREAACY
jgi:BirA family biotin operon repressor/biotin-[acetyl-CoA-carboxylase] ligase